MIIEFRGKALVIGKPHIVLAETCALMFQLRKSFERMGYDEEGVENIMQIISGAAKCGSMEEHIKMVNEVIDDAEPDEPFAVYDPD